MSKFLKFYFLVIITLIYSCSSDDDCSCRGAFYNGTQNIIVPNVDCETGAPGIPDILGSGETEFLGCTDS